MDCGTACLAMYLGLPYRVVSDAALKVVPDLLRSGVSREGMVRIARELGFGLKKTRKFSFSSSSGIVFLGKNRRDFHFVVLFHGVIINPTEGMVWEPDAYLAKTKMKPITLLHLDSDIQSVVE